MNLFSPIRILTTLLTLLFVISGHGYAAGLLSPANSSLPPLEIKQHHVDVVIEDGYAITSVEQVFYNPHGSDLEAIYSFPVPDKAAVGEFTFWIDGQPVTGEVLEKARARKIYQQEKQAGRDVAITEQDEYKTFDTSVYPVRALQDVRIKLTYIQPAHVDTSIGRYVYPLEDGGVDEEKLSFWTYNSEVQEQFSFNLHFKSTYPIDQFRLPKHPQAEIKQISEHEWSVSLANDAAALAAQVEEAETETVSEGSMVQTLDTDIVVYWRHQQGLPGRLDLVAHKEAGKQRGTFMMTVTPGDDLAKISEGRDWIFVLDYSGSMQGKYQSMVEGVHKGLNKLNANDRFRIFIFNNNAKEITRGFVPATPGQVKQWTGFLENKRPDGSTNLYDGIKLGTKALDADRSSAIILVTDGVANVGVTGKSSFLKLMENHDVRLFTFVMGNSANRPLLEGMVEVSNGFAISVSNSDDIVGQLMQATSKLTHEALHDVAVKFSGVKVKDLSPERIGSLYRGEQLIIFGHYYGDGPATVSVAGKVSGAAKSYTTDFDFPASSELNPEIERLWAFATIEDLQNKMDYFGQDDDTEQAITDLAVAYGLVTDYTSLVVMSEEQFTARGIDKTNQQRVQKEHTARQQRQAAPVRNHRVDSHQPISNSNAPSHSNGSGSLDVFYGLLLVLLLLGRLRRNTSRQ